MNENECKLIKRNICHSRVTQRAYMCMFLCEPAMCGVSGVSELCRARGASRDGCLLTASEITTRKGDVVSSSRAAQQDQVSDSRSVDMVLSLSQD